MHDKCNPLFGKSRLVLIVFTVCAIITNFESTASADLLFSENFTPDSNGRVLYDADPMYDGIEDGEAVGLVGGDNNGNGLFGNGRIRTIDPFGQGPNGGQGGIGDYYLSNDTLGFGNSFGNAGMIWGTIVPLAVLPNTDYQFSFYLNRYNFVNLQIDALVNGVAVATNLNPASEDVWTLFTYQWNSGAAGTADLSLRNNLADYFGNDFGIDTIQFLGPPSAPAEVPEPASIALWGLVSLAGAGAGWYRKRTKATAA